VTGRPTVTEAIVADPSTAGLVLDFDGVLSPIVQDPTTSAIPDHVVTALGELVKSLGLLAVMSGRPLAFLIDRVRIPGVLLLGSYGIERIDVDGQHRMDPAARPWLDRVKEASKILADLLGNSPGVRIEDKSVSVAVHWRQAPDHEIAADKVRRIAHQVAEHTGLRVEPGKLVEELLPPIDVDKGSAVLSLIAQKRPRVIAYAGDDIGDIPALRAVRGVGGYALVVDHGNETDARLLQLADEVYSGSFAFANWIGGLADVIHSAKI
jgi:trehalose 6-phosphate phosphatase